jgi:hypothetical protein
MTYLIYNRLGLKSSLKPNGMNNEGALPPSFVVVLAIVPPTPTIGGTHGVQFVSTICVSLAHDLNYCSSCFIVIKF